MPEKTWLRSTPSSWRFASSRGSLVAGVKGAADFQKGAPMAVGSVMAPMAASRKRVLDCAEDAAVVLALQADSAVRAIRVVRKDQVQVLASAISKPWGHPKAVQASDCHQKDLQASDWAARQDAAAWDARP